MDFPRAVIAKASSTHFQVLSNSRFEANGQRKRGRPKQTRIKVEESVKRIGLEVEEAANRTRWREGVRVIAEEMRCIRPPLAKRNTPN